MEPSPTEVFARKAVFPQIFAEVCRQGCHTRLVILTEGAIAGRVYPALGDPKRQMCSGSCKSRADVHTSKTKTQNRMHDSIDEFIIDS